MREFSFFLDAWQYCRENDIDMKHIHKKDFRNWFVDIDSAIRES